MLSWEKSVWRFQGILYLLNWIFETIMHYLSQDVASNWYNIKGVPGDKHCCCFEWVVKFRHYYTVPAVSGFLIRGKFQMEKAPEWKWHEEVFHCDVALVKGGPGKSWNKPSEMSQPFSFNFIHFHPGSVLWSVSDHHRVTMNDDEGCNHLIPPELTRDSLTSSWDSLFLERKSIYSQIYSIYGVKYRATVKDISPVVKRSKPSQTGRVWDSHK